MKRWMAIFAILMLALLACGSSDSRVGGSQARRVAQGVSGTGILPEPCGEGHTWNGTAIDLMVADALTACSGDDRGTPDPTDDGFLPNGGGPMRDGYLTYVRGRMAETLGFKPKLASSITKDWAQFRAKGEVVDPDDPENVELFNCDPFTQQPQAATITPRFIQEHIDVTADTLSGEAELRQQYANLQLRSPAFHLCIAQTLRAMVPGAAGGEALLLSEQDQRSLLEVIRENSQVAMLDYALLGVVFSTQYPYAGAPPLGFGRQRYLGELQWWALTRGGADTAGSASTFEEIQDMGRDFAAAVQLHSAASEELYALLVRSRSARTPRGGDAKDRADEVWGAGSWHQRLLAAALGGDPLANPSDQPWPRPDEALLPPNGSAASGFLFDIPGSPSASARADGWDWPDDNRAPYVSTALREPQVLELLRLARRFDRVQLRLKRKQALLGGGWVCDGVDLPLSGTDLYEWVEGELRLATCYDEDGNPATPTCCATDTCGPAAKPALPFPQEKYLLWEQFRIRPEHADTLVKYLADNIDYEKLAVTPRIYAGQWFVDWCQPRPSLADPDYRAGAQFLSGLMWFQRDSVDATICSMRLSPKVPGSDQVEQGPEVAFFDRPLRDIAPAYTRNAVLRFPSPWDLAIGAKAADQGFIGNCQPLPVNPGCPESSLEAKRLMGATSALAATRMMLMASVGNLKAANLPWERPRLTDYFAHAEDILRIIDGSIASESVGLRPVALTAGSSVGVMRDEQSNEPVWQVDVTFGEGNAFWQDDGNSEYRVCAVAHPAAGNLATSPESSFGGTTIESLINAADESSRCSGGVFWSSTILGQALLTSYDGAPRGWSAGQLRLPVGQDEAFTLVAVRDATINDFAVRQYEVIGSSFSMADTTLLRQGHFVATGGTLGDVVTKAIQGRTENPTEHKYDGFGLRTDWVPPFTAELIGGSSEEASADRYLSLAKAASDDATAAVNQAMDRLQQEEKDDKAMAAATERCQQGMKEEQEKLCGPSNGECNVEAPVLTALSPDWFDNEPPFVSCDGPTFDCEGQHGTLCLDTCAPDQPRCEPSCGTQCVPDCAGPCTASCQATCEAPCPSGWMGDACRAACGSMCASSCSTSCTDTCSLNCNECQHQCKQECDGDLIACKGAQAAQQLDCFATKLAAEVLGSPTHIAQPVLDSIRPTNGTPPVQPTFDEYSGGTLQSAMIEQWRAIRAIDDKFLVLTTTVAAAKGQLAVAYAALLDQDENAANQCDPVRLQNALMSGVSSGCAGKVSASYGGGTPKISGKSCSVSFSWGPYSAQLDACYDAQASLDTPNQQALSGLTSGMAAVASAGAGMSDAQAAVMRSGAEIARLLNEARLAKSRYALEKKLSDGTLPTTSFGLYRRYRSYDVWRAKALVENARRYALAARRATEARYVVNLSDISQPEAFVQSPSIWADEVYGYDLSLPAAVGLAVGPEQPGGVYPNKVGDYVSNLSSFVMGYAVTRPAAVAHQDIDVVNLPGLKLGAGVDFDPLGGTVHPELGGWVLRCPTGQDTYEWVPPPDGLASQACGDNLDARPDRARLSFAMDPWGRLNGAIANEPYTRRYNGRWGMLAVNFVGTGVKDCDHASDPYACYSEGFIRYDLSHVGPAWVTDYDGIWRILGVPIGRIEGAKGLASELWLDPLKDGWNTPYISAVTRTELQLRPLGGAYELEFEITPEINIDKIDRVQLLIGSTYWVKQD